jgi:hypothetical protein
VRTEQFEQRAPLFGDARVDIALGIVLRRPFVVWIGQKRVGLVLAVVAGIGQKPGLPASMWSG